MSRSTNATASRRRRKKLLNRAKGFYGDKKNHFRQSKNAVMKALSFNYIHRKAKKALFRSVWIIRIGVAAKANGLSYSRLMYGLKLAGSNIDRKQLAHLAAFDAKAFSEIANTAMKALKK